MKKLKKLIQRYENNLQFYVGYPQNVHFDYSAIFSALSYPINNYGDPFLLKNPISSHEYEQEVIKWFLRLFGLDDNLGWGYVTTGGTEGILFGIWQAKENLDNPVLYFSEYAHYSVMKAGRITGLDCCIIRSLPNGTMDYQDLEKKLIKNRDAIIVATLGNTITSAIDDVSKIREIVKKHKVKTFIHADAAFDGMILPFIKTSYPYRLTDGIDSISVSGHKIIGSPIPCGVVLIHKEYIESTRRSIDYINNMDCTITGSRSGFSALILWEAIAKNKREGFKKFIEDCLKKAFSFAQILNDHGINAWRLDHAITIVLDKLPEPITKKWRAPSNHAYTSLTALPKLTESMLNQLINDIKFFKKNQCLVNDSDGIIFPTIYQDMRLED